MFCLLFLLFITNAQLSAGARRVIKRQQPAANVSQQLHVSSVRCIEHDPAFARFAHCFLKPVSRHMKTLSLRVLLLKPPVTQSIVHLVVYKRANGYKPFVINFSLDICKYFAGIGTHLFDWLFYPILPYTNINHSCPYLSDMIVEKMPINAVKLPSVFPAGDYRLDVKVDAYNVPRATVMLFVSIKEAI